MKKYRAIIHPQNQHINSSEMPLSFSVVTVTFNASRFFERTLQSVISQTYNNIEYIVIDGGSKDDTIEIIKNNASNINHWISEPDKGIYDAMNKGLSIAKGDFVCFLNAGDSFKSVSTLADLAAVLNSRDMPDIIYGETDLVNSNEELISARRLKAPQILTWKSFKMGMLVCHQAFIVKRDIAPEYDLQYRFSSDFDWCIRCMKKSREIVNSNMRLINYLYEGITTSNRKASLRERYTIMCKYYGTIPTQIRHLWFAVRFHFAKLFRNNS